MNLFNHKWIYYALSILVACLAAFESTRLLLFLGVLSLFCYLKKVHKLHILAIVLLGILTNQYFSIEVKKLNEPFVLPAELTWTDEYKINGKYLRGFMKNDDGRRLYVVYEFDTEEEKLTFEQQPLIGKRYVVYGELVPPTKPYHAFSFDMNDYLKSKEAIGVVEISKWTYVDTEDSFRQKVYIQRFKLKNHIEEHFPSSLVGEAQALLIGLQEQVDDDTTRAYQKLGITHLFAISGLHIAIVSFIIFQGLIRLRVRREFATIFLLLILPIYGLLAGGAPSVWRAILVMELILISRLKWYLSIDDALSISFILFVLVEPAAIYQIGFQLSYLATASLIYSSQLLNRSQSWVVQSFLITFVCQLLVYPFLLYHFYEISLSSFLVNILFVPLFSFVILPINIVLLVTSFIPGPVSEYLMNGYEPCRMVLTKFIEWLQSVPYQMWNPGKPSMFLFIIAYVSVFVVFYGMESRGQLKKMITILIVPMLLMQFSGHFQQDLKITFLNVGQGDCIVIEFPYRKAVYVIDTGGLVRFEQEEWKENNRPFEVGKQVVVPFLKGKGITRIDKLILTHADADHVEGAEEIAREIKIKEIHITPNSYHKEVMKDLLHEAKKQKIPIVEQVAKAHWKEAGVTLQYLWPMELDYEGNNDSLVLLLSMKEFTALFTGDLEEAGELEIVKRYPLLKEIDLLKAGHHGSKTSSSEAFVNQLGPKLTIFSAGETNPFGHPHKEVVDRFESKNLKTLTTGEVGTIEVTVKDKEMGVLVSNE